MFIYIYITCDNLLCLSIYRIQILCFLYIHTAYSFLKPCLDWTATGFCCCSSQEKSLEPAFEKICWQHGMDWFMRSPHGPGRIDGSCTCWRRCDWDHLSFLDLFAVSNSFCGIFSPTLRVDNQATTFTFMLTSFFFNAPFFRWSRPERWKQFYPYKKDRKVWLWNRQVVQ